MVQEKKQDADYKCLRPPLRVILRAFPFKKRPYTSLELMEYMLVLRLDVCVCICEVALEQTSSSPSAPRVVACPRVYPASSTSRGGTDGASGSGGGSGVVVVVVVMVVVLVLAPPDQISFFSSLRTINTNQGLRDTQTLLIQTELCISSEDENRCTYRSNTINDQV
ncbi:hypothetical protein V1478_013903 [Vespula squamosa]|uniref:Uncharacterized protein n=1 Tax=Vespula squamosa TaxID=30214 RepID=A0ABD2A7B2_VESSQ